MTSFATVWRDMEHDKRDGAMRTHHPVLRCRLDRSSPPLVHPLRGASASDYICCFAPDQTPLRRSSPRRLHPHPTTQDPAVVVEGYCASLPIQPIVGAPDWKPSFADEAHFTSLFEGPNSLYVASTFRDGAVRVPVWSM